MCRIVALALALCALATSRSVAHEGPPFPIIMDQPAGPYVVSVWTDPDVGIGKFFVILNPSSSGILPSVDSVEVCVQPTSERLPEVCYAGAPQKMRDRLQYYAEVEFDQQEMWQVRIKVTGPEGNTELNSEVEATPPGFGPWDLLIYGFPFLLFGGLWLYAALRGKRQQLAGVEPPAPPPDHFPC